MPTSIVAPFTQGLGRYAEALADYGAAIRLDPKHAQAFVGKGVVHTWRDEWDDALHAFETAARLGDAAGGATSMALGRHAEDRATSIRPFGSRPTLVQPLAHRGLSFDAVEPDAVRRALDRHSSLARPELLAARREAPGTSMPARKSPVRSSNGSPLAS